MISWKNVVVPSTLMRFMKPTLRLFLFCILLITKPGISANHERILHFTEIDGLPRNITNCLTQDQYGYIWIGTNNGIARFDGKDFKSYNELSGLGVIHLLYDSNHTLWVGTNNGLFRYNPTTNFFELIADGYVSKLVEDNGAIYFLMMSNIFQANKPDPVLVLQGNDISDFCFTSKGLWVSKSNDGILFFEREDNFKNITTSYFNGLPIAQLGKVDDTLLAGSFDGKLYSISQDGLSNEIAIDNHYFYKAFRKIKDEIWIATDGNGILILDQHFKLLRKLDRNVNQSSINSNSIYDILLGKNDEIWIATFGAGLNCILPDNQLFQNLIPEKGNENSLVANEGVSVFVKEDYVYFGTNYGLSKWNSTNNQFSNILSNQLQNELNGTKVTAINVDAQNNIWVGTYDGLMGKYTPDLKLLKTYHPSSSQLNEMQRITGIREVSKDNLIILTQFHTQILLNFEKATEKVDVFELYRKGSNLTYCLLNSLRQNKDGELIAVISDLGLFHVNWKDNVLENKLANLNSQLKCIISDFYQDKKGNYWITSSTDGLIFASQDGKQLKKWTENEGLPSNMLIRIESTDDRFLWISTISGICRFDTQTNEIFNYNHRDGLPANEFQERASANLGNNKIIFGSLAGFTIIDPSKINTDTKPTEVVISDISFQNQSIRTPNGEQFLKKPLEETEEITLPFDKNSFSIHYFTKNKSFSKFHNYEYRLVGLTEDWTYQGEINFTTYTNLSPGKYIFEIKSADKSQPGTTTSMIINIRSPWYFSWYAYLIYIILFFVILYLSIYAFLNWFELQKEKEISEIKIQKEQELTEKKLAFFTNISHDLKTPLTLIDAPVNDLLQNEELSPEQTNKLLIIKRNSKRLYKLISDLLDFRQITQKQYALLVKETSITGIVNDAYLAFKEECNKKRVQLNFNIETDLTGFIDASKLEKILWNLLSNAQKFTNAVGEITIGANEEIKEGIRYLKLDVSDTGIGISELDKDKIFDRFYKVQNPRNVNAGGTGIGLAIVKELVEIHRGKIQLFSEEGAGTTFTITVPIDKKAYQSSEIDNSNTIQQQTYNDDFESLQSKNQKPQQYNLPCVLIVEDNVELREYLASHFEKNYKVYTAEDGSVGLNLAREINPNLIITDVQMPNMNGYEFCKELRTNFDTSHIPAIMLTANNTIEQQLEGLSTGADIYLTKPFDIRLLDAQVYSLLENRRKLRTRFHGIETRENLEKNLPPKDVDFVMELKSFIEQNIMNNELGVEMLAEHFSISLAQLHRKIKSLTDSTPNNLIKSIRLKIAYKLISEKGMRVSEAAYQTGFSDPNYFTTCFKKEFGENPSQIS